MKKLVLKTIDNRYFRGYTTFGVEFTQKRKEAKKYDGNTSEMYDDLNCVAKSGTSVFMAFYCNGEFVY